MINDITSKNNIRLKFARKVSAGKAKEYIFAEGSRLAAEVLRSNLDVVEAFVSETFCEINNEFIKRLLVSQIPIAKLPDQLFDSIAETRSSQGVILISLKPDVGCASIEQNISNAATQTPLVLLLHRINNPSNLGAILRTAEAVNVSGVIISQNSTTAFSPKALRGSMGASLRIPIWENAVFERALVWGKMIGLTSTCADVNSKNSYWDTDWKKGRLLVFGSEAKGLTTDEFTKIDDNLFIPMENEVESLNLAVSSALIMYEYKRRSND